MRFFVDVSCTELAFCELADMVAEESQAEKSLVPGEFIYKGIL